MTTKKTTRPAGVLPKGWESVVQKWARHGGRLKKSPETLKLLSDALTIGTPYVHACKYAGISYNRFNTWMKEGRELWERMEEERLTIEDLSKKEQWDLVFFTSCMDAEGAGVHGHIKKVATDKSWQARMTLLERRYPEIYGRKAVDVKVQGVVGVVNITSDDMTEATKNALEFEQTLFGSETEDV